MASKDIRYHISYYSGSTAIRPDYQSIHILYMIDGTCDLQYQNHLISLEKADFFLLNVSEAIAWETQDPILAADISLDYSELCLASRTFDPKYQMNSARQVSQEYSLMRYLLQELIRCSLKDHRTVTYMEQGLLHLIIHQLTSVFLVQNVKKPQKLSKDETGRRMLGYIRQNYSQDLQLNDLADMFYISQSSASRLLLRMTGMPFREYLNQLRLESARVLLGDPSISITEAALSCGFSTPSMFAEAFRKHYGMTPSTYRSKAASDDTASDEKASDNSASDEDASGRDTIFSDPALQKMTDSEKKDILHLLDTVSEPGFFSDSDTRTLIADVTADTQRTGPAKCVLVAAQISWLRMASMQQQILYLCDKLKIDYVRIWGPFASELMVYGPDGGYNFSFLDEVFDFLTDHGLKPDLELTLRDEEIRTSETGVLSFTDGWDRYKKIPDWTQPLDALMKHLVQRYPKQTLSEWIFSMEIFLSKYSHHKSDAEMLEMWTAGNRIIKSRLPDAVISGPGLVTNQSTEEMIRFNTALFETGYIPDIYTVTAFPYKPSADDDNRRYKKHIAENILTQGIRDVRASLDAAGFKGALWVNAWGCSISARNFIQDSCYRSAYVTDQAVSVLPQVDALGIFVASDLITAFSDSEALMFGGTGILTRNGIPKPAFFAWSFLRQLGSVRIQSDPSCIVTMENRSDIRILCWNKKTLGANYYMMPDNTFKPGQLDTIFEDRKNLIQNIMINGLDDSRSYRVYHQSLNDHSGSILSGWINLGMPSRMDRQDTEYLRQTSVPKLLSQTVTASGGRIQLQVTLEPNEVRLIRMTAE